MNMNMNMDVNVNVNMDKDMDTDTVHAMSVTSPASMSVSKSVFVFIFMFVFMSEFCLAYFKGLLWQRITFNAFLLSEKSRITFKFYLWLLNGQLSALVSQ
jgi:hypothetical protein